VDAWASVRMHCYVGWRSVRRYRHGRHVQWQLCAGIRGKRAYAVLVEDHAVLAAFQPLPAPQAHETLLG